MRGLTLAFICVFAVLCVQLVLGDNGLNEYRAVAADIDRLKQANERLRQRNEMVYREIADLREGSEAIEERARNELGMIKQDETFFRMIHEDNQ